MTALARYWRVALAAALGSVIAFQAWRIERVGGELAARTAALAEARAATEAARGAVEARDALILRAADNEKRDAEEAAAMMKGTCRAAFDAGYAARRCASGEPDGVRDLRALWRQGAFAVPADLPGEPGG